MHRIDNTLKVKTQPLIDIRIYTLYTVELINEDNFPTKYDARIAEQKHKLYNRFIYLSDLHLNSKYFYT